MPHTAVPAPPDKLPDIPWMQRQPIEPHRQNASRPETAWDDEAEEPVDDGFINPKKTCKPREITRIQTEEAHVNPFSEFAAVGAAQDLPASSHESAPPSAASHTLEEAQPTRKPASRSRKAKLAFQPSE
mgnify:CR=1 FL=1|jgi:hypothetical protein